MFFPRIAVHAAVLQNCFINQCAVSHALLAACVLWAGVAATATVAHAATDFRDIPYLQARIGKVLEHEPTGAEVEWFNEATGNSGMIRVLNPAFRDPRRTPPVRRTSRICGV